ncbi:MAG: hypothetical protein IKB49_00720 [Alphaproteobacteria bacterium]|nr:hypothetical protein [Alphaproteobacteria bacterium]
MTEKKAAFTKATSKVVTYGELMREMNKIAQASGTDYAGFAIDLKSVDGKKVCGFEFATAQQEMALSAILDKLGIEHSHVHKDIKSQKGELHIAARHAKHATDLFYAWSSLITIEQRITGNAELDAQWQRIVSKAR